MKVAVRDTTALRALKPLEMATYLRAKGWQQEVELNGKGSLWLWRAPSGEEFDVTLPLSRGLGDYALRMAELLHTLADVEQRSELDVLRDVQTATADLIRVRVSTSDVENGSLPLDRAVALVERSRDMMLAAACAALNRRPFFAKRKPQQAMDYLSHVRMGQTERGSFVLTILSPVPPELRPPQGLLALLEPTDPYERKVTRILLEALAALEEAARRAVIQSDMSPFNAAVGKGVSANLCDAVVGLSNASSGEGLDVQVSWSQSRPLDRSLPPHIRIGSDSIPIIEEASRQFRERAPIEDFEVEGFVVRLDRGPEATQGDVTVSGYVDGQMRSITIRLGTDNYSEAVRAHDERQTLKCVGDLTKEGRSYRLNNPRHLQVSPPEV